MRKINLLACLSLLTVLSFSAQAEDEVQALVVDNGAGGGHSAYWNRLRDNTNGSGLADSDITTIASSTRSYVAAASPTETSVTAAFTGHLGSYSFTPFVAIFNANEYSATQNCAQSSDD